MFTTRTRTRRRQLPPHRSRTATVLTSLGLTLTLAASLVVTHWAGGRLVSEGSTARPALPSPLASSSSLPCSGPITITEGGTYSGCWVSNGQGSAVTVSTREPVIIRRAELRGTSKLVMSGVPRTNVTIVDSHLHGLYPGGDGEWGDYAVWLDDFDSFTFEHNHLEQKGGIKLNGWSGATTRPVTIRYNTVKNIDGRTTDGNGGYAGTVITQFVQLAEVVDAPDVDISWNEIHNVADQSAVEDVISLYRSSGAPGSPMDVHDNLVHGAFPFPSTSTSYAGGGILLGDAGGDRQQAHDNHVVATTNHGIAIAGGTNLSLYDNRLVSSGRRPDGTLLPAGNVGVYVWNQYSDPFGRASAYGNVAAWMQMWDGSPRRNDWWLPDCDAVCDDNDPLVDPDLAVSRHHELAEVRRWGNRLEAAGLVTGPTSG